MISKFSVKKPFTIAVAVIMVFVLGVVSFTRMTTDLLPSIDLPYVMVNTTYQGATPEKVEASVTKPLEQSLATTAGLENISSISQENSSIIMLEFSQSVNMDSVMIDISGKIDMVKPYLDDNVSTPMLMKLNPDMMPIMMLSIDVEDMDIKEVTEYVNNDILPEFERIEGVASVTPSGMIEETLKVNLDNEKIDKINEKILANIDSEFAKQEDELNKNKSELDSSLAQLENESKTQSENIQNGLNEVNKGISELEKAVNAIGKTKAELEKDIESANVLYYQNEAQVKTLQSAIDKMPESAEKEKLKKQLTELKKVSSQIQSGISMAKEGITAIDTLAQLKKQKTELEQGKATLDKEMSSAKEQLTSAKDQLTQGQEQLSDAKETAKKGANIKEQITPEMIGNILMAENFSMPAGYLKEGEEKYSIRVGDQFKSVEELEDLLLFNVDVEGVGAITVKDVANVYIDNNAKETYTNINGNQGVMLAFQKSSTYSTAEVTKSINSVIDELDEKDEKLNITTLMDQGVYIDMIIQSVVQNLIYGGILAILILLVFLKDFRTTLIISFSIPISVLFAVVLMYFSGMTLNIISLSGLALGVGMLVDNSIVVIENIYRLRNKGMSMAKASVYGAKQVSNAIMASTLTTVCVFLPIVFTEGMTRQLFADMGLTIAFSLFASLVVALTVVPAMSSTMLTKSGEKEHKLFDKFVDFYEIVLKKSLQHKVIVLVLAVVMLGFSIYSSTSMGIEFIPSMDSTQMSATMTTEEGVSREDKLKMSDEFIERVQTIDGVVTVGGMETSQQGMMGGSSDESISFYIILDEEKQVSNAQVQKQIEEKTKDIKANISVVGSNMDMSALGGSGVQLIIKGNDLDQLQKISTELAKEIEKIEGTEDVSNGLEDAVTETRIVVDKNKAMEYGLTVAQVYQEVAKAVESEKTSTSVSFDSNEYPIVIGNNTELTRANLGSYELKGMKNNKEVVIELSEIAQIESAQGMVSVNRDNQARYITLTASIDIDHNIGLVGREVNKVIENYELPSGYTIEVAGENENITKSMNDMFLMGAMAVLFIYLIMVAQFQSLLSPFIVMFTIPLAFTGGLLALFITNTNISMISMLGFLVLAGIVVNNGIVFVDYINQLRLSGKSKHDAIVETGRTRIRPILMTALTTILAMSTMAMGVGMGAEMSQGLAIVTIGGLIYSTILTLVVIPVLYDLLHRKEMKNIIVDED